MLQVTPSIGVIAELDCVVACWLDGVEYPRGVWPALVVFDAEGLVVEAVVETVVDGQALSPRPPYQLVVDGAAGRVHFLTVWDGTSAPVQRGVMGVSYDVLGAEQPPTAPPAGPTRTLLRTIDAQALTVLALRRSSGR